MAQPAERHGRSVVAPLALDNERKRQRVVQMTKASVALRKVGRVSSSGKYS